MRRRFRRVLLAGLGVAMALAAYDRIRGDDADDLMRRTQSAFLDRSKLRGCGDATKTLVPEGAWYVTHYGDKYPPAAFFIRRHEQNMKDLLGTTAFEGIRYRGAGQVEVLSFPEGGPSCYDNLFIPVTMEVTLAFGARVRMPIALRVAQRAHGHLYVPFIGSELTGFYYDHRWPKRLEGKVDVDGHVPPRLDR